MKKHIQCSILSISIFIFSLLSIIVHLDTEGETVKNETLYMVTDMSVANIRAVAISNEKGVYGIINSPEGIRLATDEQRTFDINLLNSFVYSLSKIKAHQQVDGNALDYGAGNPLSQITIIDAEGVKNEYVLLSKSAVSNDYYVHDTLKSAIYVIDESQANLFLHGVLDFVAVEIVPFFEFQNAQLLENITINRSGETVYSIDNQGEMNFTLVSPIQSKIDTVSFFELVLFPLNSLNSVALLQEAPSLTTSEYFSILINMDKNYTIHVYNQDNVIYVYDSMNWYVGTDVDTSYLDVSYIELLNNVAYNVNIASLEYIDVELSDGADFFIEVSGSGQNLQSNYNGTTFDYIESGTILSPLNEMKITRIVTGENFTDVLVKIVLKFRSGSTDIIEISTKQQDNGYYVKVNGIVNFTTSELYVTNFINTLRELGNK